MNRLLSLLLVAALGLFFSTAAFAQGGGGDYNGGDEWMGGHVDDAQDEVVVTLDAAIPEALHIYIIDDVDKQWCTDMDLNSIKKLEELYESGTECGETKIRVWANCPWELKCKSDVRYEAPPGSDKDYDAKGVRKCFAMKFNPDVSGECDGKLMVNPDIDPNNWTPLKKKTEGNIDDWVLVGSKDVNNLCIDTDMTFSWYFGYDGCLKKKMLPAGTYYLDVTFVLCPASAWA